MTELKDKSTTQNRPESPVANKVGKLKSWAKLLHCEPALGQSSEQLIGRLLRWQPANLLQTTQTLIPPPCCDNHGTVGY